MTGGKAGHCHQGKISFAHLKALFPCIWNCGRTFGTIQSANKHQQACKKNEERLKCDICGKISSRTDTANQHRLTHFSQQQKLKLQCKQCHLQCSSIQSLSSHKRRQRKGIFYQCKCHQKFCYIWQLKKHETTCETIHKENPSSWIAIPYGGDGTRMNQTRMREEKAAEDTTVEITNMEASPSDGHLESPTKKYPLTCQNYFEPCRMVQGGGKLV